MIRARIPRGFDTTAAASELARRDRKLATWIRRIGPIDPGFNRRFDPVDALAHSILYQQLSGRAAATIAARVEALMPNRRRITAVGLDTVDDEALRGAGVSRNKVAALRDLAAKAHTGLVPALAELARLDDIALIERLVQVRGIGRWTVEMLLMFRLGRPDVLPVHDLGVRKGARIVYRLEDLPAPAAFETFGERWRPYRTMASLYFWKVVEVAAGPVAAAKPVKRSQD